MAHNTTRREAQRRFLELLGEAELPPPDEIHWEDESTVFLWNEIKLAVYLDPDREDVGPLDELEVAQLRGLAVDDWPFPAADGYRDWQPGANDAS
jgi:hypothetical protein